MASTCIQQKRNNFPLESLSDYGAQPSGLTALKGISFSENGESHDFSDSDHDEEENDLLSVSEIVARSRRAQVQRRPARPAIDLTCDTDDDDTETASISPTNSLQPPPSSLRRSLSHRADVSTTSSTETTPGRARHPWKNVPSWSPLHSKLQQYPSSTEFKPVSLIPQRLEGSPEIPKTPVVTLENVWREENNYSDDGEEHRDKSTQTVNGASTESITNTNNSGKALLSIAESSEQTLTPVTASGPSVPDLSEDSSAVVNISKFRTAKIVDKRSSSLGIEYMCELEPLWLTADLVGKAQMGGIHIQDYENGLIRARSVTTLRAVAKRKYSQM